MRDLGGNGATSPCFTFSVVTLPWGLECKGCTFLPPMCVGIDMGQNTIVGLCQRYGPTQSNPRTLLGMAKA